MKLADHAGKYLAALAREDERIYVVDGDLADSDGAVHFAREHPQRFIMAGIAEQNMVSFAAGMAAVGMRPFVFSFGAFLCYRAYDQIRMCISQARQPVALVASHATGLAGRNGKSHSTFNDLALLLSLPAIDVWAPTDEADVECALQTSLLRPCGSYIRLPRLTEKGLRSAERPASAYRWVFPKASVSILSYGQSTQWASKVAETLHSEGLSIGVLHVLQLKPFPLVRSDFDGISHLCILEDHYSTHGIEVILRPLGLGCTLEPLGWPHTFAGKSAEDGDLLEHCRLSTNHLCQRLRTVISTVGVS
jgi:transketolase